MTEIPEHRTGVSPRSGDSHVIGDDGQLTNTDQAARDKAAAEAAKAAAKPVPKPGGSAT